MPTDQAKAIKRKTRRGLAKRLVGYVLNLEFGASLSFVYANDATFCIFQKTCSSLKSRSETTVKAVGEDSEKDKGTDSEEDKDDEDELEDEVPKKRPVSTGKSLCPHSSCRVHYDLRNTFSIMAFFFSKLIK